MSPCSSALIDYVLAFANRAEPFLTHYCLLPDKSVETRHLSRGEFWALARRAAGVLHQHGVGKGAAFALYLSANRPEDLAFRLGATIVGAVPVTINWQADTTERIAFKVTHTECRLVVADAGVSKEHLDGLRAEVKVLPVFFIEALDAQPELPEGDFCTARDLGPDATKMIIFTSGTTGEPKGVRLPYRSYATNRSTFESFLGVGPEDALSLLIVNPMHHTNSSAMTDWALRRAGTRLHLVERYSTQYWAILRDVVRQSPGRIVAPLVSRHFDYLENLRAEDKVPLPPEELKQAARRAEFLLGSAPVGPTTVKRVQEWSGRLPLVRFGSTETCLQVAGTSPVLPEEQRLAAFERGWAHKWQNESTCGYYIGRPHPPCTELRIVRSVTPGDAHYLADSSEGEPGWFIARGGNVMQGYVKDEKATEQVLHADGWYTGFGDVGFWIASGKDGERDYYWLSRESALLVRGGAKYAYAQVEAELSAFLATRYELPSDAFEVAVVGLRLGSEHEDTCCVTVELLCEDAQRKRPDIERTFLAEAPANVTKGAKPDRVRFAQIPRNFKGVPLVPALKEEYLAEIKAQRDSSQQTR